MNDFNNDQSQRRDDVRSPRASARRTLRPAFRSRPLRPRRRGVRADSKTFFAPTRGFVRDCLDEAAAADWPRPSRAARTPRMPADVADRMRNGVHDEIARMRLPPRVAGFPAPDRGTRRLRSVHRLARLGRGRRGDRARRHRLAAEVPPASATPPSSSRGWTTIPMPSAGTGHPGLVNPAEGVTGYVTFSPESQEGYMLIKGLEPNDPRIQQYQLWIWDQDREPDPENPTPLADNVHPVDGGVFDVNDKRRGRGPDQASASGRPRPTCSPSRSNARVAWSRATRARFRSSPARRPRTPETPFDPHP